MSDLNMELKEYIEYLLKYYKKSKLKNKTPEELKEMYLKKQLCEILEKKGINVKRKTYSELKACYDRYINNSYINKEFNDIELSKDILNKLWLEILE